jgi:DNA polymerase III epsilon subunit family exonuclease
MPDLVESPNHRYEFLIRRAIEFLGDEGGRATEEQIVQHVFGAGACTGLWSSLLRQVLATEPALSLLADGRWALAGYSAPPSITALGDFTALDVETTGLRPLVNRIIEVAAIRFRNGRETERFVSFLQPDKPLPGVIVNLTGIRDADLEEAPPFPDIADDLLTFLGDDLIVGHNVGFDIAFVNGELKRMNRPGLLNQRFDTLAAANRLLPEVKRKSLGKLAASLGIPDGRDHRAYDDARRTAEVALRLVETAVIKGIKDPQSIRRLGGQMPRQHPDGSRPRRNVLDKSLLTGIARAPGVYLMYDGYGHVIYIGKARNLRERVGSYFSQALEYTRKMDGLLESLVSIETHRTGSELQALLLEAQLIRFYQPRYNTALRASENYPYIKINIANAWPRVALTKAVKDDGALYFGPYKSRSTADRAIEAMNTALPLRTCTRSFKNARSYGKPCLKLDLGQCIGPCTGQTDRGEYRDLVHSAVHFLEGDASSVLTRIDAQLKRAVEKQDAERARTLRALSQSVESVAAEQQSIAYAVEHHHLLLIQEGPEAGSRDVMLVLRGLRWAQFRIDAGETAQELAFRLARSFDRYSQTTAAFADHASLDDALILNRWIRRQSGHPCLLPFTLDDQDVDWLQLAERALALGPDELTVIPDDEPEAVDPDRATTSKRDPSPGANYFDPGELNDIE